MRFFEFNINIDEMATLAAKELLKYKGKENDRIPILLKKIRNSEPFTIVLKNNEEKDVIVDPAEFERVKTWAENPTSVLQLKTLDPEYPIIPLGNIKKTREFGGKDSTFGLEKEISQIDGIQGELAKAKGDAPSVELKIGDRVVNVASVEKEKTMMPGGRAPKSDLTAIDEEGKSVAWVSLKTEDKKRGFRWGGWSHLTQLPEIKEWIERIKSVTGNELEPGQSFGLHISDELANKIVFGKNFGGERGPSNVDLVLIGEPKIENGQLSGTRSYANGETPQGDDRPYILIRYMNNRPDLGFKNARAETNPMSEKRNVTFLDDFKDVKDAKEKFPYANPSAYDVKNADVGLS